MVAVGVVAGQVTRPIFGRHGFAGGALVVDWPAIVGPAIATYSLPTRVRFPPGERSGATLEIKVANSAFAPELTHLEPLVVERINSYFGWAAVARLKLRHGPLPRRRSVVPPPPPPPTDDTVMTPPARAVVDKIANDDLRQALAALGRAVAADQARAQAVATSTGKP